MKGTKVQTVQISDKTIDIPSFILYYIGALLDKKYCFKSSKSAVLNGRSGNASRIATLSTLYLIATNIKRVILKYLN